MEAEHTPLQRAIAAVGSASELARQLGIKPSAVAQWDEVPPKRVLDVERLSGISRYELRPDIFGAAEEVAA